MVEEVRKPIWSTFAVAAAGSFAICALAIWGFYGLPKEGLYPYKNQWVQTVVIVRVAAIATAISLWAIWVSSRARRGPGVAALWTGIGVLITLVLYGVAGCGGVLGGGVGFGGWQRSADFFFPSLLFAEFNFLTFTFEVAPTTAVGVGILVFVTRRVSLAFGAAR